jgi:hypothetical protein
VQFATKHIEAVIDYSDVGEQFHTDMGFVNRIENYDAKADSSIRKGFRQTYGSFTYRLFPEGKSVIQHRFKLENFTVWNRDFSLNEHNLSLEYEMIFRNTSNLSGTMSMVKNNLPFHTGNIVKYAVRAGHKIYDGMDAVESEITDLEKVRRYAEMRINQLKGKAVL